MCSTALSPSSVGSIERSGVESDSPRYLRLLRVQARSGGFHQEAHLHGDGAITQAGPGGKVLAAGKGGIAIGEIVHGVRLGLGVATDLGRPEEGRRLGREAVEIFLRLFADDPGPIGRFLGAAADVLRSPSGELSGRRGIRLGERGANSRAPARRPSLTAVVTALGSFVVRG